jgi:hypothetical protein
MAASWSVEYGTSFIDECEPDFAHSPHVGEPFSAASDTLMIALAVFGLLWSSSFNKNSKSECRHPAWRSFGMLLITALASVAYHTTLNRTALILDIVTVALAVLELVLAVLPTGLGLVARGI